MRDDRQHDEGKRDKHEPLVRRMRFDADRHFLIVSLGLT
jgi:hypothetical protein